MRLDLKRTRKVVFYFWVYESGVVEASSIEAELHSRLECWFCCFYCVCLSSLVDSKRSNTTIEKRMRTMLVLAMCKTGRMS